MDGDACSAGKSLKIDVPPNSPIFLQNLPMRVGPRPKTNPCLPHQQRSDNPTPETWSRFVHQVFSSQASLFPGSTGPHRSKVSLPDSQALFLDADPKILCRNGMIGPEWAHVHGVSDGSMHLVLSAADAAILIDKGWGELHLMAGQTMGNGLVVQPGLVMVYGPRDDAEIATVLEIMKASYQFARGDIPPPKRSA